ncbi:YdeI/OmpD-associated family protein [Algoriphagus sp. CAU 1675]|uniref:YdeI/OmpD-associated family protein n=1 Tax=Algoriphagus sp. CAU 1675 TaxID=3032597 RepID=UPI0023DC6ECE|nr:YdeI/OmpD-associated family protein [Algoriphagus sp. CAU 1675]MDF2157636.1 YdeI/OmpD-associated family protein [Algoriphagus sp. CAU 1675]
MKTFEAKLSRFDFNHWQNHIPVPDPIAAEMMDGNHRRVLVYLQDRGPFHMALMKAKDYWYLLINQDLIKSLHLEQGISIQVKLEKDNSEFGHEVPEEFEVLLDQDKEGNDFFRTLTPGKQRSLIYLVSKVKNPESRMKKSLAILHHLKVSKGRLDFKQLNEWIKFYNNL